MLGSPYVEVKFSHIPNFSGDHQFQQVRRREPWVSKRARYFKITEFDAYERGI